MELDLDNGKYTYIYENNGRHEALRHGEPWRNLIGDNLVLYMGFHIQEQQQQIDALKAHIMRITEHAGMIYVMIEDDELAEKFKQAINSTPEQSLAEHDREIYNKAIKDCIVRVEDLNEGANLEGLVCPAIRQLYKGE